VGLQPFGVVFQHAPLARLQSAHHRQRVVYFLLPSALRSSLVSTLTARLSIR
jgi:hypothetical protein